MKAKELKQWQLFYNTNNYLCLVYKVGGRSAHIVNYNGTFYKANLNSEYEYSNKVPPETVEEFFMNFPMQKIEYYKDRDEIQHIKNLYYCQQNKNNKLLLII